MVPWKYYVERRKFLKIYQKFLRESLKKLLYPWNKNLTSSLLFSSPPSYVWLNLLLAMSSHKTFRIKRFLAKKQKQGIVPFPSGFKWKLVIKSGTTPREDIGEEPSWVCKEPRIWGGTHFCWVKDTCILPYHTENITTTQTAGWVLLGKWCFSLCQCFCTNALAQ